MSRLRPRSNPNGLQFAMKDSNSENQMKLQMNENLPYVMPCLSVNPPNEVEHSIQLTSETYSPTCPDDYDVEDFQCHSFSEPPMEKLRSVLKTSHGSIFQCKYMINHIASFDEDLNTKCETIAVVNLLPLNSSLVDSGNFQVISVGVDILIKYGIRLLKPQKNFHWRSIKLSNVVIKSKLQPLKGYEDVLREFGYTEQTEFSFDFSTHQKLPDVEKVASVTADLLILQSELNKFLNQTHVNSERFLKCFSYGITEIPGVLSPKKRGVSTPELRRGPFQQNYQHTKVGQDFQRDGYQNHRRIKMGVSKKIQQGAVLRPLVVAGVRPRMSPVKAKRDQAKKKPITRSPTREEILQLRHEEVVMKDVEVLEKIEIVSQRCRETMNPFLKQQQMSVENILRNKHDHLMDELAEIDQELATVRNERGGKIQDRGEGKQAFNSYQGHPLTILTAGDDRFHSGQEMPGINMSKSTPQRHRKPVAMRRKWEAQGDGCTLEEVNSAWNIMDHDGERSVSVRELDRIALDITREFCQMHNILVAYQALDILSQQEIHEAWLRNGCDRESTVTECLELLYDKVEELLAVHHHMVKNDVACALMENGFNIHRTRYFLETQNSYNDFRKGGKRNQKIMSEEASTSKIKVLEEIERSQLEEWEKREKIRKLLMAEHGLTWVAVDTVFALREEYELCECIEAVKAVGNNLQQVQEYFQKCTTCFTHFGMHKLVALPTCECLICTECFTQYFTVLAKTTPCMYKFSCPGCNNPNLEDSDQEKYQFYFSFLGPLLKTYLEKNDYELYEVKLATWGLMEDPNFIWCAHGCSAGFINERQWKKVQCPECKRYQCFDCKKPWMDQHKNISCEEFDAWKKSNDPEFQQQGLAAHLKENGINCPKCKMRYELAKGGCMHFKCPQCHHQFCCGCNLPFRSYPACNLLPSCKGKGLHAHHPRDCFYYLRDEDCRDLQQLLQKHKARYNATSNAAGFNGDRLQVCPVMEQQETPDGLVDATCGKPLKGQCGLCENHYKEYLVGLINHHNIDPVEVFTVKSLAGTLRRNDRKIPVRVGNEANTDYCARLRQEVQQQLPLRPRNAQGVSGATYQI